MSATLLMYEEVVDYIRNAKDKEIIRFWVEVGYCGVEVIKLPCTNENFVGNQLIMRTINDFGSGSVTESAWKMVDNIREIHEILVDQFDHWRTRNILHGV